MVSSAPSWRARASFSSLLEVAMTRAPCSLAIWMAKTDTPPVPSVRMVSPALIRPTCTSAFHAVTAAHGSVAASS